MYQKTISIRKLPLAFNHNPPLVECCGLPRPLMHEKANLQTKHRDLFNKMQQQEVDINRLPVNHLYEAAAVRHGRCPLHFPIYHNQRAFSHLTNLQRQPIIITGDRKGIIPTVSVWTEMKCGSDIQNELKQTAQVETHTSCFTKRLHKDPPPCQRHHSFTHCV